MWDFSLLRRIDLRVILVVLGLMLMSLLVISSQSHLGDLSLGKEGLVEAGFWTSMTIAQFKWFVIGWMVFFLTTAFDYQRLRNSTWIIYGIVLILLFGLFFTDPIQRVQRWYKLPFIGMNVQPSEYAKLSMILALSWWLEKKREVSDSLGTAFIAFLIVFIPFVFVLKQPDLGSALVLWPIALSIFYFGNLNRKIVSLFSWGALLLLMGVSSIFLGLIPFEEVKPFAKHFIKDYQIERLNPATHHQKAAGLAIALGGPLGVGFRNSEYSALGWLPAPYTDSVFPAFAEEFGFLGVILLMALFYALIYFSLQVSIEAKDLFGRFLSVGISMYLAIHILVNIGMMSGFLPITGVPLILITYGGSSILSTMLALGLLQSIYVRRFMF